MAEHQVAPDGVPADAALPRRDLSHTPKRYLILGATSGIAEVIRKRGGQAAACLLMEKELTYLGKAITDPSRPFVAIIGGAKVSDKIEVINAMLDKVDALLIGGAMAYTFLNVKGQTTGKSLVEADKTDIAKAALDKAEQKGVRPRRQIRRRHPHGSLLRHRPVPRRQDGPRHRPRDHQALRR